MQSPRALLPAPVRAGSSARAKNYPKLSPLDERRIRISRWRDYIRTRDYTHSFIVIGGPGSGKSSGVIATLQRAAWDGRERSDCGVIFSSKWETAEDAAAEAGAVGRTVIEVNAKSGHSIHLVSICLDIGRRMGIAVPTDVVMDVLWSMVELLHRSEVAREGDNFFLPAGKNLTHDVMSVLIRGTGTCDIDELVNCIRELPQITQGKRKEDMRIYQHIRRIIERDGEDRQTRMWLSAFDELVGLSDRTLTSICITATTRMSPLLKEPIYSLFFAKESTITPEKIERENLLVCIDFPVAVYWNVARAIGGGVKSICQKYCMTRPDHVSTRMFGFWLDEGASFLTDLDIEAIERGRSSRMYHVFGFQTVGSIRNGYGGDESKAKALFKTVQNLIFCRQADSDTRQAAEETGAKSMQLQRTTSVTVSPYGEYGQMRESRGENWAKQYMPNFPEDSLSSLSTGQNGIVEGYYYKRGDIFNYNRKTFLKVRWLQNHSGFRLGDALHEKEPTARPWRGHLYWWEFWQSWRDEGTSGLFFKVMNFWYDGMAFPDKPGGTYFYGKR